MKFNAWQLSRAWASVALAQSNEKGRPALHRTTLIEMYEDGIRLVSTDSYILLKAWVPHAWHDVSEPGADVLPEEVAICVDTDHRVLALMKYAQKVCAKEGIDTEVLMEMGVGEAPAEEGQLAGLVQDQVWFRLDHERYDEQIVAPQYEGTFPEWRPLWFGHRWQQTGVVQFGADGILRLGKLSALWDKAAIEFHLGGGSGVAKVIIRAPHVNVSGLAMPLRSDTADASTGAEEVPPSEEGVEMQYGEALDKFLAEVLATEEGGSDDEVDEATETQLDRAWRAADDAGHASVQLLVDTLDVSHERASELIAYLIERNVIGETEELDKFVLLEKYAEPAGPDEGDEEPL